VSHLLPAPDSCCGGRERKKMSSIEEMRHFQDGFPPWLSVTFLLPGHVTTEEVRLRPVHDDEDPVACCREKVSLSIVCHKRSGGQEIYLLLKHMLR
jgi:hypothetical protein